MKCITINIIAILTLCSSLFTLSNAQTWDSLGGGVKLNYTSGKIGALCTYNGNLIVGGAFDTVGDNLSANCIAQWNGTLWSIIQTGPDGVYCLLEYNGNIVAGSVEAGYSITTLPGKYGDVIGQWNGAIWDTIGSGLSFAFNNPQMLSLCEYSGNLYAGGYYMGIQGPVTFNAIGKWNGMYWDSLPKQDSIGEVLAMAVYNGLLYAGGILYLNGSNNIAGWNGTTWSAAGTGVNGKVYALAVYNGKLYAGGIFDSAGGKPAKNIAVWNGISWSAVGSGVSNVVYSLASYGSVLIAGGKFDTAGGILCNKIAQWDGTSWVALGSGVTSTTLNVGVYALCSDNGNLYVGGEFDSAGGIHANSIAVWTSPLGVKNIENDAGSISIYPNPSTGIFTIQSSVVSGKWSVEVYNVLGEKVLTEIPVRTGTGGLHSVQDDKVINLTGQPNGVYLYKVVKEDGGVVSNGKIIIEK